MSSIIEEFYYGNIEPQELSTEITPKLKKKLSSLVKKEEELTAMLPEKEKNCSPITFLLTMSFQVSVILTALYRASGSEQDLLMILLLQK